MEGNQGCFGEDVIGNAQGNLRKGQHSASDTHRATARGVFLIIL